MSISNITTKTAGKVQVYNDKATIESLNVIKQTPIKEPSQLDTNKDFTRWLNNLISHLRDNGLDTLQIKHVKKISTCKEINFKNKDFINYIKQSGKINFNPNNETVSLIKKYDIKNKTELLTLLKNEENGIKYDEDLKNSYGEIERDVEELKKNKKIKTIQSEKDVVLFYRDTEDEIEKLIIDPSNKLALNLIREIWRNECKLTDITKPEQKLDLNKDNEQMLKRKRKNRDNSSHLNHLIKKDK